LEHLCTVYLIRRSETALGYRNDLVKFILSKGHYALPIQKRVVTLLVLFVFFGLALSVIHHEMQAYPLESILQSFDAISYSAIIFALIATLISYAGIAFYDGLALRYIGKSLSWRKTIFTSCCAHAISATLGMAAFTSNAVRYRLYSSWGIDLKDIAAIGIVTFVVSITGAFSIMAFGFLAEGRTFEALFHIPPGISIGLGFAILSALIFAVFKILTGADSLGFKQINFKKPSAKTLGLQWLSSAVDWIAAAAVLYVLMPQSADISLAYSRG